jgi:2-aminoadipate transaminase
MLEFIHINGQSEAPLYRQVYEQIRLAIERGTLLDGSRLPPTRLLADQLGLNRTTISAAYSLLESGGLIEGHVGRGSFVKAPAVVHSQAADVISFASSRPADNDFPIADLQAACRDVTSGADAASILQLGSPYGFGPLRSYLLDQALDDGTAGPDDDILITSGCQQALDLVQRVLARPGVPVVVEDPVYHGVRQVFSRDGMRLSAVAMGADGMDVERLARTVAEARPQLLVVTPTFQNPTGATMPVEARARLLAIADQFELTVIENDIYGALRYEGEPVATLKQMDRSGRVILLRSFSKIAFPGLRVGWVVARKNVIARLAETRQWCDLHTDQLSQAILLRFAESGRLSAHVERVKGAGRERIRAAFDACERHLPAGSNYSRPRGGMNLWVELPAPLDAAQLLPHAERERVTYLPGSHFAVARPQAGALRLSFGSLSPESIRTGIAILGRVFHAELGTGRTSSRLEAASALV